ncbi:T9SS type A sorting domain-containing protein, partial [bacterium]|nr:T9SS type A sorting domain-containing protein [bacterium]
VTPGAYQTALGGTRDGFITKMDPNLPGTHNCGDSVPPPPTSNQDPDCSGAAIADQSAGANCRALISGADVTGITDPDGDPLTITVSPTDLGLGTNSVTVTADDGNGGMCSTDIMVNVIDNTAPVPDVATLPDASGECSVTLTAPTATDNCAGSITATTTDPTTYTTQGSFSVTWTYDDGNGNTSQQTQNVIVDDVTDPVVTCSATSTGEDEELIIKFSATDNCGVASLTAVIDIGCKQIAVNDGDIVAVECDDDECEVETDDGILEIKSETATLIVTATDGVGNTATCTQDLCAVSAEEEEEEEDLDKKTADPKIENGLPEGYVLLQNHPNPFNPNTTITFAVPEAGEVTLGIYNLKGQLIRTLHSGAIAAGRHSVIWNARDSQGAKVASGVYLYKLEIQGFVATKRLVLMK